LLFNARAYQDHSFDGVIQQSSAVFPASLRARQLSASLINAAENLSRMSMKMTAMLNVYRS
jgi:hypothetical protein